MLTRILKKLIKRLLKQKLGYKHSSSDYRYSKRSKHPSRYGHSYYKKRRKSSSSYSS